MSDISVTVALADTAITVAIPAAPVVTLIGTAGPSGPNEVWIGPDYPTDPTVEFWWRTTDAPASVWDLGTWDVDVWGAVMPVTVTVPDHPTVSVAAPAAVVSTVSAVALPGAPGPNEIHIGPDEPTDPNVEFWYKP